jgi:hypothetical protein
MNLQKVTFKNTEGETLVGRIELPADQQPHNFAEGSNIKGFWGTSIRLHRFGRK